MTDTVKLKIFNLCGAIFNLEPFTEESLEEMTDSNLVVFDSFLPSALSKAMRETNWSFLLHPVTLEESGQSFSGFEHAYKIPQGTLKIVTNTSAEKFRRIGNIFLTDGSANVFVIYKDVRNEDEDIIPEDFWTLVAYQLAFLVFGRYPDTAKYQHIVNAYNTVLSSLLRTEVTEFGGVWGEV